MKNEPYLNSFLLPRRENDKFAKNCEIELNLLRLCVFASSL